MKAFLASLAAVALFGATAAPASAATYYHNGVTYKFIHNGEYYKYRHHGEYFNHRECTWHHSHRACKYW